jgi:hypothetical protein
MAVRFQVHLADALVDRFGGVLLDPQMQLVWGAERWRADRALGDVDVRRHVVLHADVLCGSVWMHTHGLVKFGKPDLEILGLREEEMDAGARLLNHLARHLSGGAVLAPGDRLEVGGARVVFQVGGTEQPNDFDNECLRIVDDVEGASGASAALARLARTTWPGAGREPGGDRHPAPARRSGQDDPVSPPGSRGSGR